MIDWLGMIFTLTGSLTVIKKNKYGFLLMLIGCLWWIGYGYNIGSVAVMITNVIFSITNFYGFYRWNKE